MTPHRVAILGAGPAGLGAAYYLRRDGGAEVTVVEQQAAVGGNAGSFEWQGVHLDFGSHRLHPASDRRILDDVKALLGDDLLDRPRHGRIRLRNRWIHFPLKPVDLLLRLDPAFAASAMVDTIRKVLPRTPPAEDSFAAVLWHSLGPTICRDFYFPYARKIWGRAPEELSGIQARRRVAAGSVSKIVKKVLTAVPGLKPPGAGRFYYPRRGFGAIASALGDRAVALGASLLTETRVSALERTDSGDGWRVHVEGPSGARAIEADYLWSTIPVTTLARLVKPAAPGDVIEAAGSLRFRSMILVYLALEVQQFTEFDAHYFPAADVRITRLSEPKNYADTREPRGRTVLCAELPCDLDDDVWKMSDAQLGELVVEDLRRSGLDVPVAPSAVMTRRLRQAYPLYLRGYERAFDALDTWVEAQPRVLTFGRQGLFAHDNTHHALYMARCAAGCLTPAGFDGESWQRHRAEFARHVVED